MKASEKALLDQVSPQPNTVFSLKELSPGVVFPMLQNYDFLKKKTRPYATPNLILVVTMYCPLEPLIRSLFFDIKLGLVAYYKPELSPLLWFVDKCLILVNNHIHTGILFSNRPG